jgi:hypothetical protein
MSDGSLGTHTKFKNLLRHMSATELSSLFQAFGFEFVSTQFISRVTKAGKFNLDIDQKLNRLIVRVEDLIDRFKPAHLSFNDSGHVKLLLDILDLGVDLQVGAPIKINSDNQQSR